MQSNMNSTVNILDLCDEMLLTILNKLDNVDVLYSLIGVNQKFDRLARSIDFTQSLDLTTISSYGDDYSKIKSMFNRFCFYILPQIQHNIQCLTLDPWSMTNILSIENYPKLHKLTLINLKVEMANSIFCTNSSFVSIFQHQISNLVIMINGTSGYRHRWRLCTSMFAQISMKFTNLTHFQFDLITDCIYTLELAGLPSECYSSSIVHLNLKVKTFNDCLWLLNGHLSQLHTLVVHVEHIHNTSNIINNRKTVSNLKCFSLTSFSITLEYDNQIIPLLHHMSQLEKLTLSLYVDGRTSFIDGTHLNNDIISKMPYLHRFNFDIVTEIVIISNEYLPTSDDVRRPLIEKGYNVDCYVDYLGTERGRCHIYSVSSTMERMHVITNKFPDGIFMNVRIVYVSDSMHSIEYDFFVRISQAFPLLKDLTVLSTVNQQKSTNELDGHEQTFSIIEYSHLMTLDLISSHIDYAKQFLLKTSLPRLSTLGIDYEHLINVTEDFTSSTARANCANLKNIIFRNKPIIPGRKFFTYFPLVLNIHRVENC
ncbi:unnamed protein product [Rotaria socialis]|uniref:F-box domain-containing protein n=3 Tax=Rotaria socialis TaxID=392032 RepID=A0A821G1F7_9BILA|nr:unnamed protein product [Rotaria socialis]